MFMGGGSKKREKFKVNFDGIILGICEITDKNSCIQEKKKHNSFHEPHYLNIGHKLSY